MLFDVFPLKIARHMLRDMPDNSNNVITDFYTEFEHSAHPDFIVPIYCSRENTNNGTDKD